MSTNFRGDPLSNGQILRFAQELRRSFGLDDLEPPDMIALYEKATIFTRFGLKHFAYKIVPDLEIDGDDASTLISPSHVRIRVSDTTFQRAQALDRRARFTLAHELGHAVLHNNKGELARGRQPEIRMGSPVVSVERQADRFADNFLVTDAMVHLATSAEHLAELALVSDRVSDIIWEREQSKLLRPVIANQLRNLSAELRQKNERSSESTRLRCPVCSEQTLLKLDSKYYCAGECNRVFDAFPDGDGPIF